MEYLKTNPHPKGKKIGDCVVRAIAVAEARKWSDVYKELCDIGAEIYNMPNSKEVYGTLLERNGWKKQKMPKDSNGRRIKLRDFARDKKGLFIAHVVSHLTVVENGTILDTWNCGHKCVGNYFTR